MRNWVLLLAFWCTAAFAASSGHGLGVGVGLTVGLRGASPNIIATSPDDGSSLATATPAFQFVFDIDMNTTLTDTTQVLLPKGMQVTQLVWADARTLNILYSGSLLGFGAKRVALFDNYFRTPGNVPIPKGSGLAFDYGEVQPVFTINPSFSPAAPSTNDMVTFTTLATSPVGATLNYSWSFGDGTVGSGATAAHQYAAAGPYLVVVTVTDGLGGSLVGPMLVVVTQGAAAIPPPVPLPWTITHANINVNFKTKGRDKITLVGTVNLAAGFDPTNKIVTIGIGAINATFTMDKNGRAKTGSNRYQLTRKLKKKVFLGGAVPIHITLNGDFASSLAALGFTNATTPKVTKTNKTNGILVTLPVLMTIDKQPYIAQPQVIWKARVGANGTAHFALKK